jgi:hypothetical protein
VPAIIPKRQTTNRFIAHSSRRSSSTPSHPLLRRRAVNSVPAVPSAAAWTSESFQISDREIRHVFHGFLSMRSLLAQHDTLSGYHSNCHVMCQFVEVRPSVLWFSPTHKHQKCMCRPLTRIFIQMILNVESTYRNYVSPKKIGGGGGGSPPRFSQTNFSVQLVVSKYINKQKTVEHTGANFHNAVIWHVPCTAPISTRLWISSFHSDNSLRV